MKNISSLMTRAIVALQTDQNNQQVIDEIKSFNRLNNDEWLYQYQNCPFLDDLNVELDFADFILIARGFERIYGISKV